MKKVKILKRINKMKYWKKMIIKLKKKIKNIKMNLIMWKFKR